MPRGLAGFRRTLGFIARRKIQQTEVRTKVAEWRVRRGIYQHELARETGISIASLKRLERGAAPNAPLWWYVNCAITLNVDITELFDDALRRWHATPKAAEPPSQEWYAEHWELARRWANE